MRRALALAVFVSAPLASSAAAAPESRRAPDVVHFKTEDGQTLEGSFYKPGSGRAPAVILVHDAGASRSQLEPLADRLFRQGFGVLAIDLRAHGGSKSAKLDWEKLSDTEKESTWSFAPRDIDAAAKWLLNQPNIHSTNLSLVGYRAGNALVVRHAKNDENVVCMALLAPNAKDYGFDVKADIHTLEGLPTFVVTSKDEEAEHMAQEANAASTGNPYIELSISVKLANPIEDKKLPAKVATWISDKAMPKKGR